MKVVLKLEYIDNQKKKKEKKIVLEACLCKYLVVKVKVEGDEEVHPGNDHTSRSVARNQVPRYKSDF